MLQDRYYNFEGEKERYMIQTRSQTKASGVQLPEIRGTKQGLDPHKIPGKTTAVSSKTGHREET